MNNRISKIASYLNVTAAEGMRDGCITAAKYASQIDDEYECVRARVGMIDLDHYAKIKVMGEAAFELVDQAILTDLARLPVNQLQLTFLLDENGKSYAEAYVANFGDYYLLLCEGCPSEQVFARLAALADAQARGSMVIDQTDKLGMIGVDGPYSWELLKSFMGIGIIGTRYLEMLPDQVLKGMPFTLCRAGKTGEYGYMLITDADHSVPLWQELREIGARFNALPLGYRVIDTCKLENRFISQHHEGQHADNVIELNTRVMVSREKGDYVGRQAIEQLMETGAARRQIGVAFDPQRSSAEPVTAGDPVSCGGQPIGKVVNAAYSPTLKRWIGLALVDAGYAYVGLDYQSGAAAARTVSAPFIFNKSLQIRAQEDSYFKQ